MKVEDPIAAVKAIILDHVRSLDSSPSFDNMLDRLLNSLIRTTSIAVLKTAKEAMVESFDDIIADVVSQREGGVDEG